MAIYHFSVQVLGRGKGRRNQDGSLRKKPDNAVAAAAYRAGETMTCERTGKEARYGDRKGVAHSEILAPDKSAGWLKDRNRLWNTVEAMETRVDAQLAREINMALPHQLSHADRAALVRSFVAEQFVSRGMVADFALHNPVAEKGDDPRNFHAHVMLSLRRATPDGLDRVKTREWNARENIGIWRKAWQDHVNQALKARGFTKQVDHRSLNEQREEAKARGDMRKARVLDRAPEIHVGPRARAQNARGYEPRSRSRKVGAPRRPWEPRVMIFTPGECPPGMEGWWVRQRDGSYKKKRDKPRGEIVQPSAPGEFVRRSLPPVQRVPRRVWTPGEFVSRDERDTWLRAFEEKKQASLREREYARTDRGTRTGFLWDILLGNNARAKTTLRKIDRKAARFDRWFDYWNRRATFWSEGAIRGGQFRYDRLMAAQKEAHARRRAKQMADLRQTVRQTAQAVEQSLSAGLVRAGQVARWLEAHRQEARVAVQSRVRTRVRARDEPSDPNGHASGASGGNRRDGQE